MSNGGLGEPVPIDDPLARSRCLAPCEFRGLRRLFRGGSGAWLLRALDRTVRRDEIVVARIEIDYLRPVTLEDEELLGSTLLFATGEKQIITDERLSTRDGTKVARSRATLVLWDPRRSASRKLTAEENERLAEILNAQAKAEAG